MRLSTLWCDIRKNTPYLIGGLTSVVGMTCDNQQISSMAVALTIPTIACCLLYNYEIHESRVAEKEGRGFIVKNDYYRNKYK